MKLFLVMLFSSALYAAVPGNSGNPFTFYQTGTPTNISSTFPSTPQLTGPTRAWTSVDIYNNSSTAVEVNCSSVVQPGQLGASSIIVPATTAYSTPINANLTYPLANVCWFRSTGSTITNGVEVVGWGF